MPKGGHASSFFIFICLCGRKNSKDRDKLPKQNPYSPLRIGAPDLQAMLV